MWWRCQSLVSLMVVAVALLARTSALAQASTQAYAYAETAASVGAVRGVVLVVAAGEAARAAGHVELEGVE